MSILASAILSLLGLPARLKLGIRMPSLQTHRIFILRGATFLKRTRTRAVFGHILAEAGAGITGSELHSHHIKGACHEQTPNNWREAKPRR